MFKIVFYFLIAYLLYKLIFDVVVPVSKATSQVKDRIREMQEEQLRQQQAYRQQSSATPPPQQAKPAEKGDYLDFEEVK